MIFFMLNHNCICARCNYFCKPSNKQKSFDRLKLSQEYKLQKKNIYKTTRQTKDATIGTQSHYKIILFISGFPLTYWRMNNFSIFFHPADWKNERRIGICPKVKALRIFIKMKAQTESANLGNCHNTVQRRMAWINSFELHTNSKPHLHHREWLKRKVHNSLRNSTATVFRETVSRTEKTADM